MMNTENCFIKCSTFLITTETSNTNNYSKHSREPDVSWQHSRDAGVWLRREWPGGCLVGTMNYKNWYVRRRMWSVTTATLPDTASYSPAKHSSLLAHSCLCIRPKLAVSAHMLSAPPAGWPAMSFDIFVSGPRGQMLICPASVEGSTSPAQQPIATSCQIMIHPNFEGLQAKRSAVNQNYFASSISVSSPLVLPTRLLDFRHRRQTGPSSFDFPA